MTTLKPRTLALAHCSHRKRTKRLKGKRAKRFCVKARGAPKKTVFIYTHAFQHTLLGVNLCIWFSDLGLIRKQRVSRIPLSPHNQQLGSNLWNPNFPHSFCTFDIHHHQKRKIPGTLHIHPEIENFAKTTFRRHKGKTIF